VKDDIYTMAPINRTAGLAVGQSGCDKDDELTSEQLRDNLRIKVASLQETLNGIPNIKKNAGVRKTIGKEIHSLNLEINSLKDHTSRDITHYIVDVVRDQMTRFQWDRVVAEARESAGCANE